MFPFNVPLKMPQTGGNANPTDNQMNMRLDAFARCRVPQVCRIADLQSAVFNKKVLLRKADETCFRNLTTTPGVVLDSCRRRHNKQFLQVTRNRNFLSVGRGKFAFAGSFIFRFEINAFRLRLATARRAA